jgi:ribonuclease J
MDHSAFDAAAFEIKVEGKTVIYTGDFRAHGRKAVCLDYLIKGANKNPDVLLIEGTMFGRSEEKVNTEDELKDEIAILLKQNKAPVLFQCSSQNIDRLVTFYKATKEASRTLVIDIYTANVLTMMKKSGNNIPFPSKSYPDIKVFFPHRLTNKIFEQIGGEYAKAFSSFYISKKTIQAQQENICMLVRPSMLSDFKVMKDLKNGTFIYSLWNGYRYAPSQKRFEDYLISKSFHSVHIHTSGHAKVDDIKKVIKELSPKFIIPVHTFNGEAFKEISDNIILPEDEIEILI